jgi:membrane-bound lytic murein transglycosylase D
VKPGESLWLIAKKFPGVSADNIMEWNEIDTDIRPGQVLKIFK